MKSLFSSETWEDVDVSMFLGIICYKHDYICLHINIFNLMVSIAKIPGRAGRGLSELSNVYFVKNYALWNVIWLAM